MSDAGKRARLIVLEGAEPSFELGVIAALLGSEALEGAVVVAALRGGAAALGRYQRMGRTGYVQEVRRLTGGRSTSYGDGILSLCAVSPASRTWLDEKEPLPGPRLLNRYVRGLLTGLRSCGVPAVYPGRDFVTARGRRAAYVTMERPDSGAVLFQAVIGGTRAYPARDPDPDHPGLPALPQATSIEMEGGDPRALRALAAGFARRFSLDLFDAPPPQPAAAPVLNPQLPGDSGEAIAIPIGQLAAHVQLAADGTLAQVQLTGDWIASSADVLALERALVGQRPEAEPLTRVIAQWLSLPGNLVIGLTSVASIVEAIHSAACRSG